MTVTAPRGSVAGSSGRLIVTLIGDSRAAAALPERLRLRCLFHAVQALRTAIEFGKDTIRVEQPGCPCEFAVATLIRYVRRRRGYVTSLASWDARTHRAAGNLVDRRLQTWPGFRPHTPTPPFLQAGR